MGPGEVPGLESGVARGIGRLARPRDHRRLLFGAAFVVAAASSVFVEVHIGWLGHGTHLLILLLLVMFGAFIAGPAPAAVALAAGAATSLVTWGVGFGPADSALKATTQLVLYLAVGVAFLVLLAVAIRGRPTAASAEVAVSPDPHPMIEPLSHRELDVVRLVAAGMTTEQIAVRLFVSTNTVKTHLSHAYAKLDARNRTDAVRAALYCGCLTSEDICPHHAAVIAAVDATKE